MLNNGKTSGTVRFVGHDAVGLPVKRRQVHQACLECRKKKKRCHHAPDSSSLHSHDDISTPLSGSPTKRRRRHTPTRSEESTSSGPDRDTSDAAAQLLRFFHHAADKASATSTDADPRPNPDPTRSRPSTPGPASPPPFLGDLNPEGILVEATMAQPAAAKTPHVEGPSALQIGFVPPVSPRQSRRSPASDKDPVDKGSGEPAEDTAGPFFSLPREDGSRLTIHVHDAAKLAELAQALATRALAEKVLPSESEWAAMRDTFLTKIHPIFPLFDRSMLVNLPESSGLRELVQAAVCLAAATDPEAAPLLTFKTCTDGTPKSTRVSYDEYSHALADFIKKRLAELQKAQQIPLVHQIQVMALTCLYWQPAGRSERFEPLDLYARLASLVHTHGIHLGILPKTRGEGDSDGDGVGSRLFKCLYAIDRLITAIAARPLLFHNIDIMQIPRPESSDPPIFRLFLSLILLLDQVFEMYRPRPTISYIDIPVFERMVIEAGAQYEPESLLATLEVLYHAIGVLSVRMPRHRFRTAPECDALHSLPTQHLPPSSVNARRSHSADRILDALENYKLSPAPFVPYASTLSLSVAYRKWRFSRLPMFRARGGADFKKILPVVQRLGAIWGSARINGQLGQAVMRKLDQIESCRKKAKAMGDAAVRGGANGPAGEDGVCPKSTGNGKDSASQPTGNSPLAASEQNATPSDLQRTAGRSATSARPSECNVATGDTSRNTPNVQGSSTAPTASTLAEQAPPQPLQSPWTIANGSSPDTVTRHSDVPQANTTQPKNAAVAQQTDAPGSFHTADGYHHLDDSIPLPGDLSLVQMPPVIASTSAQPTLVGDTVAAAGLAQDANPDEFLVGDDALFKEWDPLFAQSVDFSFSSILDPGNPFAWPEYGEYL